MTYAIVPSSIRHVKPMSQHMRAAGAIAVQAFGLIPRSALHRAFVASNYCRTALREDKPIAMWGVAAPLLGDTAAVWLVLAQRPGVIPHAIVREARAELERVAEVYSRVMLTVLPDDEASVRFALHLGFRPTDGELFGDENSALTDPRFRIPIGDSYVVQMGYAPTMVH
jgi:hypothetical protein